MKIELKTNSGKLAYTITIGWKPKTTPFFFRWKVVPTWESMYKLHWLAGDLHQGEALDVATQVTILWLFFSFHLQQNRLPMSNQFYTLIKKPTDAR